MKTWMSKRERQWAYQVYLESDHWKNLREQALNELGRKCSKCGETSRLQVHHVHYRYPWESGIVADLKVLCADCHQDEHDQKQCVMEGLDAVFDIAAENSKLSSYAIAWLIAAKLMYPKDRAVLSLVKDSIECARFFEERRALPA